MVQNEILLTRFNPLAHGNKYLICDRFSKIQFFKHGYLSGIVQVEGKKENTQLEKKVGQETKTHKKSLCNK
jgi:hypothetical protein